jgi:hypothetical protein
VHDGSWIGFGIAEQTTGGMAGADIVTVTVAASGSASVSDQCVAGGPHAQRFSMDGRMDGWLDS